MKQHRDAKRFEKRIAADIGGRRVPFSGAGVEKADVRSKTGYKVEDGTLRATAAYRFRVEAKTTGRKSYTFTAADWDKVAVAADAAGEHPVFAISFLRAPKQEYALLRDDLAVEFGFVGDAPVHEMERSWCLNADKLLLEPGELRTLVRRRNGRTERLRLVDYNAFRKRLTEHGHLPDHS